MVDVADTMVTLDLFYGPRRATSLVVLCLVVLFLDAAVGAPVERLKPVEKSGAPHSYIVTTNSSIGPNGADSSVYFGTCTPNGVPCWPNPHCPPSWKMIDTWTRVETGGMAAQPPNNVIDKLVTCITNAVCESP
eukprot:gene16768-30038_t